MIGILVSTLIAVGLYKNYKNLTELKKRGLHAHVFGKNPGGNITYIVGVILLFMGFFSIQSSAFLVSREADKSQKIEISYINKYKSIIEKDEKAFLEALKAFGNDTSEKNASAVKKTIANLKAKVDKLNQNCNKYRLSGATSLYFQAVKSWEKGVKEIFSSNPDLKKVDKRLKFGDELKLKSIKEFKKVYNFK